MTALMRGSALSVSILLASAAVTLAACNGGGVDGDTSPTPKPSPTATEALTPDDSSPDDVIPIAEAFDLAAKSPTTTIYGIDAGDFPNGFSTLASGDFNDDDRPDILIGVPFGDGPDNEREDAGEAYVVFGPEEWPSTLDLAAGDQDMTIYGHNIGDNLGSGVLAADINADGIDDVIVGAPGVTAGADPRTDQGRAYVFFGSSDLGGTFDIADDPWDFVVTGAEGFSRIGQALAAGDVNDDGMTDLVLGAPFAGREPGSRPGSPRTETGEMYVIFGSPSLSGERNTTFGEQDFTVTGNQRFSQFGVAVASADVNGDGVDDIVVGAPQTDLNEGQDDATGAVYVFLGRKDLGGRLFIAEGEQDAVLLGASGGDALGLPLGVADVNDDGIGDIVVGARAAENPEGTASATGATIVIFGGDDLTETLDLASAIPDAVVYGTGAGELAPASLSLTDLTGDGTPDLLLTTVIGPRERRAAGIVHLIPGGSDLSGALTLGGSTQALTVVGSQEEDGLGAAITPLPTVGGSPPAFFVLASGADGPDEGRPDSGEIYLIEVP